MDAREIVELHREQLHRFGKRQTLRVESGNRIVYAAQIAQFQQAVGEDQAALPREALETAQALVEQRLAEHDRIGPAALRVPQHREMMKAQQLGRAKEGERPKRLLDLVLGQI